MSITCTTYQVLPQVNDAPARRWDDLTGARTDTLKRIHELLDAPGAEAGSDRNCH